MIAMLHPLAGATLLLSVCADLLPALPRHRETSPRLDGLHGPPLVIDIESVFAGLAARLRRSR